MQEVPSYVNEVTELPCNAVASKFIIQLQLFYHHIQFVSFFLCSLKLRPARHTLSYVQQNSVFAV